MSCFSPFHSPTTVLTSQRGRSISIDSGHVFQDLDLYFIRQIASSLKEYDLEQKIDLELKMREGTLKLLAACKHPTQTIEAAKNLLTSNERMTTYMHELQQRKERAIKNKHQVSSSITLQPCKAKVSVSGIRMPLIWKDSDHFKNKGDYRRFAVFCLMKIGTEVYDTMMINNVDRSMTDITVDEVTVFNNVSPDFDFHLEIYSHMLQDDLSIASTPRKIKQKISESVGRTVGKKLAANLKEELNAASVDFGPKFDLIAKAVLCLDDVSDYIKTFDLVQENLENSQHQLPLFGHFCCRLAAQPVCLIEDRMSGFLSLQQQAGNLSSWRRLWCCLKNLRLSLWARQEDSTTDGRQPIINIPITQQTKAAKSSTVKQSWVIIISNPLGGREVCYSVAPESESEQNEWLTAISQHIKDHESWQHACDSIMEIRSPSPIKLPAFMRKGSLYDETSLRESPRPSSTEMDCDGDDTVFDNNTHTTMSGKPGLPPSIAKVCNRETSV